MARKVKCPKCDTMNDKDNAIKIGSRYYCKNCAEEKKQDREDWNELFEYICKLYDIKKPTGMMFKQLKDFRNEPYNFTNKGMYLTLKYFYQTLGNEVKEDTGLGIIPYYYEKAKQHFIDIVIVSEHLENFQRQEKQRIIKIKPYKSDKKIFSRNQLPFNDIQWEDGDNEQ